MEENKKYYTRSDGSQVLLNEMNTEHVINGLAKKYRELFESQNKTDYSKRLATMNDLKEELYKRFNVFYEGLDD